MESLLLKIFATALALSQVMTAPDAVKTQFDRVRDQPEVAQLLHAGCTHMVKAFELEDINIDDLIATAMEDPQAISGSKALRGIDFADLQTAYRQFCKNEPVARPAVDLGEVIDFYNKAAANLPDHSGLKGLELPGASVVLDRKGAPFAEVFEDNQRRIWVPLAEIPQQVRNAFVAAEDKRFYEHKGIDEHGLIRAFVGNLARTGRPQGGSTITQQVAKNLLVGEELSYERKIREMIVAARIEATLGKDEILEIYLNSVYLGRSSWGVEMAARSYFGKPAKQLTVTEGALLAALTKGPRYLSPDRQPARAGAARLRARPDARGRDARGRGERRAIRPRIARLAGNGEARSATARYRIPLHRPGRPRGQIGGRPRCAHRQFLHGAFHHRSAFAARGGGGAAGRPVAVRTRRRPRAIPGRRGQPRGSHPEDRGRRQAHRQAALLAAGARRGSPAAL
jgi:hypothetical protein